MEIKVNNNISPKTYLSITIIAFILAVIFGKVTIDNVIKLNNYTEIDAKIIDVETRYNYESDSNDRYIILQYEYNNKTYTAKQKDSFKRYVSIGSYKTIHINPQAPGEVYDNDLALGTFMFAVVMLSTSAFCLKAYKKRKEQI